MPVDSSIASQFGAENLLLRAQVKSSVSTQREDDVIEVRENLLVNGAFGIALNRLIRH